MRTAASTKSATHASSFLSLGAATIGAAPSVIARDDATRVAGDGATRFELGEEIARGGMGRIVEGWDPRHERKVAIKLLLHRTAPMARRFAGEARITARLQHPAIVPIYDSGYGESGEPFYAMKLVDGRSLGDAVRACGSIEERLALLPHIIAITDALGYAHARRVIHRDLKPSNVLLGAFGETVVIDWGLAKELDSASLDDPEEEPPTGPASALTIAGRAIGTPRYMPPEQARGDAADERSDVYALGALLYHVLAGVSPYDGASGEDALARVIAGPPSAVSAIEPRVPAELATIVAKAMARTPSERYASAAEMAADLKRFAAGQLVSVHSYTLGALARRWAARHTAPLVVAAVLLLALAAVAALSVRRIVRERDRADAANLVEGREREAMATQRDAAEKLVGFAITSLRDQLEQVGRLDVLAGVGKEVNGYYESVAPIAKGVDLGVLERRASAAETLAGVEDARHEPAEARALYDSAEALREELVARRAGREQIAARVSEGAMLVGRARFELSERSVATARVFAKRAVAIGDAVLAAANPNDSLALPLVARAHAALAVVEKREGKLDAATAEAERALDAARRLVATGQHATEALRVMGIALDEAAGVDQVAGRFDSKHLDEGVEVRERLVAAAPNDARDQLALSKAYELRAFCRRDENRLDLALADARRAEALRAKLAARDPDNSEWQRLLGQSYDTLCSTQQLAGRSEEAIASCRESIAILERVAAKTPDAPTVNDNLLLAYQRLGWVFERNRRFAEAAVAFQSSVPIAERFAARDDLFKSRLADARALLADLATEQGDRRTAREQMAKVVVVLEALVKPGGAFEKNRTLIFAELELAELDDAAGEHAEATRRMQSALERFVSGPLDLNEEREILLLAKACAHVATSGDKASEDAVNRAIAILEPLRVSGASPAPRLALLARARRSMGL